PHAPRADQARAGGAAYAVSQGRQDLVVPLEHGLSLVRYDAGTSLSFHKSGPAMVAALAGGRHLGDDAGAGAGAGRGTRDDAWGVWRWMALVPPGQGGGEGVARGGNGQGGLIHGLTAGDGL